MKKHFLIIASVLAILTLVFANVKVAFERNGSSNFSVLTSQIALADDEGGGVKPLCVELGLNYPGQQGTDEQHYCAKSGKTETTTGCSDTGPGCQEVKWKD